MTNYACSETKAFPAAKTFEDFKEVNDERLDDIERRGTSDILLDEKLERIDAHLNRQDERIRSLALKAARPQLDGGEPRLLGEHGRAFQAYIRRGDTGALGRLEAKALSIESSPDGGYTVTPEVDAMIGARLAQISPIRRISTVRQVSSATFRKPFASTGFAVGWVGEQVARPQTTTPTLNALDFPTLELYAMPAATGALLDDSAVDIERWIADEVETAFAEQEGRAFVVGNGTSQPRGFLTSTIVAEASWSWGRLGYVTSGAAADFVTLNPSDRLVDLVYALRAGYRQNASFVMNRRTQSAVRKFKDTQGHYLWQPPAQPGGVASLMNFPVIEAEDMPDIGADTTPIAFGDFRRGYLVVDRIGTRILRDPYSAKPYILFYTTKRVGGGVQDFNAIKLLKIATT
ncbi:MAG: phage major capsid protein [Hyphomicrobiales bacterium]|nr:phage major capsid protein [Hyphomicrobiales bacterium]OQW81972.1 MAG: capsid protein [Proteobacteria bacterium ST_bin15]